jgi:putative dimethyl sulfoxide reductase chaperone
MDIRKLDRTFHEYTDVADLRSALYRLFAIAFRYPSDEVMEELKSRSRSLALLDMMGEIYSVMPGTSNTIRQFKESILADAGPENLQVEYARLFVGPFHLPAPPYESVYRDGSGQLLMGQSTLEVRSFYLEEGLDLSETVLDLPDHIIAEMEFMSHLCATESCLRSGNSCEAEKYLEKQERFLSEHLSKWVPAFTQAISSSALEEFFRLLAGLTNDFIAHDQDYVRMLIGEPAERRYGE